MAVLKDLIVHGRSRFVNGIDADSIHANLIDAKDGIFKTITTTTLDAETITTDMLNATNARVSQTLTVDGTISTNKWEAANIANIGGNFYISPTGKANSGNITVTKTGTTTINGVSVGVYTLVVGSASFGVTSTSSIIWGTSSKVIFTGSIAYSSSKKYPLGTCNGTMTSVSTGTNTLTGFTITGVNSPALDIFFNEVGVTSVSDIVCTGYEMQISVYQSYYSSALHPIGILLTSYGKDKMQYIDIYGGANTLGDSASGFANPSVRIGQLDGLPDIRDGVTASDSPTKPSGWGIYTDNGFFKGKIVANAGRIGNWTIESNAATYGGAIYNGTFGSSGGVFITPSYTNSTAIGGSSGSKNWTFTAGNTFGITKEGVLYASSGKIGGWTIDASKLYSGTHSAWNSAVTDGVYLGNDGIAGGNGGVWYLWKDGSAKIGAMTLSTAGVLTLGSISLNASGTATIGPWTVNSTSIYKGNATQGTAGTGNMYFGNNGLSISNTFTVSNAGVLNATGAVLKSVTLQDSSGNTKAIVDGNGLTIYDGSGTADANKTAIFGSTTTIGYTSGNKYNIYIDGNAINLRYNTNILNKIDANGMKLYLSSDQTNSIADFGETIRLGTVSSKNILLTSNSMDIRDGTNVLASFDAESLKVGVSWSNGFTFAAGVKSGVGTYGTISLGTSGSSDTPSIMLRSDNVMNLTAGGNINYASFINLKPTSGNGVMGDIYIGADTLEISAKLKTNGVASISGGLDVTGAITGTSSILLGGSCVVAGHVRHDGSSGNHYCGISENPWTRVYTTAITLSNATAGTTNITGAVTTSSSLNAGASVTSSGSFIAGGHCRPDNNTSTTNNYLGTSDYRWNKIYAKTATIDTSDAKEKDILGSINYAKDFIMNLNPVQYQWKESDHKRIHMGFVAQEVAEVGKKLDKNLSVYEAAYKAPSDITDEDYNVDDYKYNGEDVDDKLLTWGLSYTELIAPLVQVVQDQQHEIDQLKKEITQLKNK